MYNRVWQTTCTYKSIVEIKSFRFLLTSSVKTDTILVVAVWQRKAKSMNDF